jgi:ribosomal-protein-alanine N-acetyltransferase
LPGGADRLSIRAFSHADLQPLLELEGEIFGETAFPLAYFVHAAALDPSSLLLAVREGQCAGYLAMPVAMTETGIRSFVFGLAVHPDCRGRGIGRALLAHGIAQAEERGALTLSLFVSPDNPARRLYESLGFASERVMEDAFGPGHDRLLMVRNLR